MKLNRKRYCECGCGMAILKPGNRFVSGHNPPWNKGIKGAQQAWNKGLDKETDARVAKYAKEKIGVKRPDMTGELNCNFNKRGTLHHAFGKPAWNTGLTKETDKRVLKISNSLIGKPVWNKGVTEYNTKPCSEEQKKKLSALRMGENNPMHGKSGEQSPTWKGGISTFPYSQEWNNKLKTQIRKRDKYICRICGVNQKELKEQLTIHHIDYDKGNCQHINLISLCRICHSKTNFDREKWEEILSSKLRI